MNGASSTFFSCGCCEVQPAVDDRDRTGFPSAPPALGDRPDASNRAASTGSSRCHRAAGATRRARCETVRPRPVAFAGAGARTLRSGPAIARSARALRRDVAAAGAATIAGGRQARPFAAVEAVHARAVGRPAGDALTRAAGRPGRARPRPRRRPGNRVRPAPRGAGPPPRPPGRPAASRAAAGASFARSRALSSSLMPLISVLKIRSERPSERAMSGSCFQPKNSTSDHDRQHEQVAGREQLHDGGLLLTRRGGVGAELETTPHAVGRRGQPVAARRTDAAARRARRPPGRAAAVPSAVCSVRAPRRRRAPGRPARRGCTGTSTLDLDRRAAGSRSLDPRAQLVDAGAGARRDEHRVGSQVRAAAAASRASAASTLLNTSCSGTCSASMSASTSRTARICASGSASDASTTCRIRSASATSSSVERNASTSWGGRCRTKPTVSVSV